MSDSVQYAVERGIATARLSRRHGNAINADLVEGLASACRRAEADPGVRGLLLASSGKLFCPGLDLQELIELDRVTMDRFLTRFAEAILDLYTFSKPMVAALHGHAVAGGCVLALCADWRVLKRGARVGLNEVRVGVPFPYGVAMILQQRIDPAHLAQVALFGSNHADEQAIAAGLADELADAEGFESHCRSRLEDLADRDPRAFAITKRYLRASTAERMRDADPRFGREFLDAWFSKETSARVTAIVDQLRARE